MCYMLSRPDGWKFYLNEIVENFSDGRDSIRGGLKELCDKGFISISRQKDSSGRFQGWVYVILLDDKGDKTTKIDTEIGFSVFGDPDTNNIDNSNTEEKNTENTNKIKNKNIFPLNHKGFIRENTKYTLKPKREEDTNDSDKPKGTSEPTDGTTLDEQANVIYELYPVKVFRRAAINAIKMALEREGYTTLYTKTQKFATVAKEWQIGANLIHRPDVWFNSEGYNDDWESIFASERE